MDIKLKLDREEAVFISKIEQMLIAFEKANYNGDILLGVKIYDKVVSIFNFGDSNKNPFKRCEYLNDMSLCWISSNNYFNTEVSLDNFVFYQFFVDYIRGGTKGYYFIKKDDGYYKCNGGSVFEKIMDLQ